MLKTGEDFSERFSGVSVLTTISLFLLCVPTLFWPPHFGESVTVVGGDIPNTLFLDPASFILRVSHLTVGVAFTGPDTFLSYLPIAVIALTLKYVGLNPELVISGITLSATFLGMHRLVSYILRKQSAYFAFLAGIVGGFTAISAPLITESFWTSYEPRLYLLPLTPWLIYTILRFVDTGRSIFLFSGVLGTVVASAGISDIPGMIPTGILIFMVVAVLYPASEFGPKVQFTRLAIFGVTFLTVNAFWLFPFILQLFSGQSQAVFSNSVSGKLQSLALISSLGTYSDLKDLLGLRMSVPLMQVNHWTTLAYSNWFENIEALGFVPAVLSVLGVFAYPALRLKRRLDGVPIFSILVITVVMIALISVKYPPGARQFFDYLTTHLPGWVAVKNFYETFAIPMVVSSALLTSIGFFVLCAFVPRNLVLILTLVTSGLLVVYGLPLFIGDAFRLPYYGTSGPDRVLTSLPKPYREISQYIVKTGSAPTLSLPLLQPSWTYLTSRDTASGVGTYIGIPPLFFLNGVQNYVGVSSFESATATDLSSDVDQALLSGQTEPMARVLEMLGVRWIISDMSVVRKRDYRNLDPFANASQSISFSEQLDRSLHAKIVMKRGQYELLKVPFAKLSPVTSFDDVTNFEFSSNAIERVAANLYSGPTREQCPDVFGGSNFSSVGVIKAVVSHATSGPVCILTYRTPYSNLLSATITEGGISTGLQHVVAYGFANGFELPPLKPGKITVTISDKTSSANRLGAITSLEALALSLLYFISEKRTKSQHRQFSVANDKP